MGYNNSLQHSLQQNQKRRGPYADLVHFLKSLLQSFFMICAKIATVFKEYINSNSTDSLVVKLIKCNSSFSHLTCFGARLARLRKEKGKKIKIKINHRKPQCQTSFVTLPEKLQVFSHKEFKDVFTFTCKLDFILRIRMLIRNRKSFCR